MRTLPLVVLAGCGVTGLQPSRPVVSETAQPFALASSEGRTVSLAESLAGGPVVLVFYRGHW
jgi:hypothetical protein